MQTAKDIERFTQAQDSPYSGYSQALKEIQAGRKTGHWIWYIFPQLVGLGHSPMSRAYGIRGREEAEAYLAHPVLGARLREISRALLAHSGRAATEILGPVDAMKVRSCMTLFDCVAPGDVFGQVLEAFYGGGCDRRSIV